MAAYYNEFDANAAAWLRELIKHGLIADGEVDTRSIEDVSPDDLRHFTQCHFFAGIGGWSVALRLAGWADDRPVWTGSCPCQPFSSAGKGGGFADERHLWPAFFHLIGQCRPAVVFGEQVASKDGLAWFDLVRADLEGTGHAVGAADLCAASVGAPHIRQRLYWVADDHGAGRGQQRGEGLLDRERPAQWHDADRRGADGGLADSADRGRIEGVRPDGELGAGHRSSDSSIVGHTLGARLEGHGRDQAARGHRSGGVACVVGHADEFGTRRNGRAVRGALDREDGQPDADDARASGGACFWTPADWLPCRDGKWRPVEPGTFPLAHGLPARVGRLRGYGNAIVPQVAATFVEAYLDTLLA